jgi:UDP-glucose 4-epimerase
MPKLSENRGAKHELQVALTLYAIAFPKGLLGLKLVMTLYLVTGGCGFIGSHLCSALVERGYRVRILDDLSTGLLENVPAGTEVLRGSVADPDVVNQAMTGVAGCFHLAAIASVERSTRDWFEAHRTNLSGTIAVFEAASKANPCAVPVVYASSAAVYGCSTPLPLREAARVVPLSPYGVDKYAGELHGRLAFELFRVPNIGLRFFNVYGPRQQPGSPYSGVISIFCDRLLRRQSIEVFGSGLQTRDFIFVGDVTAALLLSMQRVQGRCDVFNVCTGMATSILELAAAIGEICDSKPELRFRPPRVGEIANSVGNPGRIRRRLGLTASASLRAGLRETIAWMSNKTG